MSRKTIALAKDPAPTVAKQAESAPAVAEKTVSRSTASVRRVGRLSQALLCCPPDADAAILEAQLRRLGLTVVQQWPLPETITPAADLLLLLSVDTASQAQVSRLAGSHTGVVLGLLQGAEARLLERLGTLGLHGVLLPPYRFTNLQAQLAIATAAVAYQARLHDKVQHLESQLRARRVIEHATRVLMVVHEITPHEAYERLRSLAMSQRRSLVEAAQSLLNQTAQVTEQAESESTGHKKACSLEESEQAVPMVLGQSAG